MPVLWVPRVSVQSEEVEQVRGKVDGDLLRDRPSHGREDDLLARLKAREALVPALLRVRGRDDDVRPKHLEAAEQGRGDDGGDGLRGVGVAAEDIEGDEQAREEVEEEVQGDVVQDRDMQAAKRRPGTPRLRLQVADRGADLRRDGCNLLEEEVRLLERPLFIVLSGCAERVVGVVGFSHSGHSIRRCSRSLDHRQSSHDTTVDVLDLDISPHVSPHPQVL